MTKKEIKEDIIEDILAKKGLKLKKQKPPIPNSAEDIKNPKPSKIAYC
jgi:hypothetical protein